MNWCDFDEDLHDQPLDVDRCLRSGQIFRWQPLGKQFLIQDGGAAHLVSVEGGHLVGRTTDKQKLRELFRLDLDVNELLARVVRKGPELGQMVARHQGLRVLHPHDPNEVFFTFLCTPNNHISRISKMVSYLGSLGEQLGRMEDTEIYKFPTTETIASLDENHLRVAGFGYRAKSIVQSARHLSQEDEDFLLNLRREPHHSARAELLKFHGVGKKLADCIALFGLRIERSVPIDTHLYRAMVRHYFRLWEGMPLTNSRYEEAVTVFQSRFGDQSGWAQQLLFLEALETKGLNSIP